jgi:hypothetical protein
MIKTKKFFPRTRARIFYDSLRYFSDSLNSLSFVNRYAVRRLIQYYGGDSGHLIDIKRGNLGYGFLHYAFIRNLRPKKILCVGSGYGFIPAICALACKDNRFGQVDFVDAGFDESHPKSWAGVGFWQKNDPKRHFALLGLDKWIESYIMTSEEFSQKFPKNKYGYIYIDGDHSYEGVKKDFQLFWPKLEKGGLMAFHDVVVKNWGKLKNFGVWKFWQELEPKSKIIFPFPKESGLGILQK